MRKITWIFLGGGILTGLALFMGKTEPSSVAPLLPTRATGPAAAGVLPLAPAASKSASTLDLSAAAAPLPYDADLPEVNTLREEAVEAEIIRVDARLAEEKWVERASRGELKKDELLRLRSLLHHRNQLFERKLELAGL